MQPPSASANIAVRGELRRDLGFASATAAVTGECIAVGIFLTPAGMAKALGSPLLLLLVWIVMGTAAAAGAICYGELATRYPYPGGTYVYLREAYGEGPAFLYGWMTMLIMDPGVTAALALGMMGYFGVLIALSSLQMRVLAIFIVLALAAVNMASTRAADRVMRYTAWLKIALITALPLLALTMSAGRLANLAPLIARRAGSPPIGAALGLALVSAFYSFGGWWDASKLAGEVRDQRVLSRAFLAGVGLVTLVYIAVSGVFLYLVPLEQVTGDQGFVAQAGQVLFGAPGARLLSLIVVTCVIGSMSVLIMGAPRVYYAMARDGVFFVRFGQLSRTHTPVYAIAVQAVLTSALILAGNFQSVVSYFMFPAIFFIAMTVAGVLRNSVAGNAPRRLAVPCSVFLSLAASIEFLLLLSMTKQALIGSVVVLLGIPVWFVLRDGFSRTAVRAEEA